MSYIRFSPDMFIGKQELEIFQTMLRERERILLLTQTKTWGLIKNGDNIVGENFNVRQGATSGTIKFSEDNYAIDSNANLIKKIAEDNIPIPADNFWYFVKINYLLTNQEQGTVSIAANGNLTGEGTDFLSKLRGVPDFPSKIKFTDITGNISEYEVVSVTSDTVAALSGVFIPESNLHYKIVGTFTPGITVTSDKKYPFNYDACNLALTKSVNQPSTPTGLEDFTPPFKVTGLEFFIAIVKNTGTGLVTIFDTRSEFFKWRFE